METEATEIQNTFPAVTVLVVDRDEHIRCSLGDLLEEAGYAVFEAETLREAETLIDASPEPLVLIIGDAEVVEHAGLKFFMAVAANPVTRQAYVYLTTTPQRWSLPAQTQMQMQTKMENSPASKPFELASFLAVVAAAAAQIRA